MAFIFFILNFITLLLYNTFTLISCYFLIKTFLTFIVTFKVPTDLSIVFFSDFILAAIGVKTGFMVVVWVSQKVKQIAWTRTFAPLVRRTNMVTNILKESCPTKTMIAYDVCFEVFRLVAPQIFFLFSFQLNFKLNFLTCF